ncbi:hypothetical protein MPTK1_6g00300 [Marchantia polymorpha subsp. ruderalis]|uniref:Uncharacterized protein n=2 Tax=Marchantia polymorpha TaxID=3197 RepID=A0AAF6BM04_MARPO|nr:hypothetical protein MARPO_0104s0037 [Marchantia polymorpha]BBN13038.1 hypothetical protein Mp_6g00300 [Marchantia polymorpha subsp. ruderalis]|eukprot:PTQ32008.1 hypothetical protein MARPO_0104s0037 [Marchantia polymorpha]
MATAVGATAVMNTLSWRVESAAGFGSTVDVRQRLVLRSSFLPSYFARMQGTRSLQPSKFGGAENSRWKKPSSRQLCLCLSFLLLGGR